MEQYKKGSFHWYLFMSGSFVTTIAKAIQLADRANRERLRRAFPQMVAAHDLGYNGGTWDDVPEGFDPVYNADIKETENFPCESCRKFGTTICGDDTKNFKCFESA